MQFSAQRVIAVFTLLLLSFNTAAAAGPPLPKALADAPAVSAALNNILEIAKTGSRTRWEAPSGRHGFITINRTWFPKPDQPCREYLRSLVNPDGKPTLMHGTGCRDNNGLWMLLETQRRAISAGAGHPPASAAASPRPTIRVRPTSASRSPAASSSRSKPSSSTKSGSSSSATTGSKTSAKTSTKTRSKTATAAPAKAAPRTRTTTKTTTSTAASTKPPSPSAPAIDPAAAAVIDASQPTPAEW